MFAKLFNKSSPQAASHPRTRVRQADLDPRVTVHYGIPSTASILALDRTQSLLAIGTLDGRIKVIGGDNIQELLTSPKPLPFKNLEFLQNQGFLASVSSENEIQVWDLEQRRIASSLQWECNITAFSVIYGTNYMYIGSEYAIVSVLKYDVEDGKIKLLPYYITANFIAEAAGMSLPDHLSVVGVLHQPNSLGNRLLVAYENGLIILWDASEDRVVLVRGSKDLKVKEKTVTSSPKDTRNELSDATEESKQVEKEISSLCWVSDNGSILAVGYVDGDIMFWDLSTAASTKDQKSEESDNNVAKLQLSSGDRRLPVIVLHWSANMLHKHHRGQLFVYGGDEIGSQEVLTVLSLDWSSGIESLKCISRTDLTLNGSFADMALLPTAAAMESSNTLLVILTNQGQLQVYDKACLSALMSEEQEKTAVPAVQYPMFIPTIEPYMTVAKLALVNTDKECSSAVSEQILVGKINAEDTSTTSGTKWPLTGGVPSQLNDAENYHVERVYVAGYQDGSVRIWDATYPALSLICVLGSEVKGIRSTVASATVSALDFCSVSLRLAVGDECGLVRLYKIIGGSDGTRLHFVTTTEKEVHDLQQGKGPQCMAVFSILDSPICILQFANFGGRLAVGFECGRVAMLDISTLSVLFLTDSVSNSSSPVICLAMKSFSDTSSSLQSPEDSESKNLGDPGNGLTFIMTRNGHIVVIDSSSGNMISSWPMHSQKESTAVSMHIIEDGDVLCDVSSEKHSLEVSPRNEAKSDRAQTSADSGSTQLDIEPDTSTETAYFAQRLLNVSVLLCCENTLQLCSLKSVLEGDGNSTQEVDLVKPCCWTTVFKKDGKDGGLIVFYQTGVFEIRSLPNLEVVGELSLMSILRWNFKTNMDKTICSSDHGQIILVNGCELAFLSLLSDENEFRIPGSLPCLHDKVIAAATDVIASLSLNQKQQQVSVPGILGGIIKGLKAGKMEQSMDATANHENFCQTLENLFSSPPFLKPSTAVKDDQKILELNIDDLVINEPVAPVAISSSSSFEKNKNEKKDKGTEKARLFEGATSDTKPKMRTAEEIKAKYRDTGDVAAAAAHARDKLAERQEKLEKLSQNSEELRSGAEDFASMAKELAKRMENRKWWHI
ncbi:hypothetical protein L3X38_014466 [Prunus dulcis]|uniref:V-SNARE coiled-coil homology domain-containing protein n=1 Tax=Prunus dulcis TaxID=3755 RepID=A0AAD4WQD4_PRUDU|nr:hypothetical protein L3X38_014466 [Prunus dulcis]